MCVCALSSYETVFSIIIIIIIININTAVVHPTTVHTAVHPVSILIISPAMHSRTQKQKSSGRLGGAMGVRGMLQTWTWSRCDGSGRPPLSTNSTVPLSLNDA